VDRSDELVQDQDHAACSLAANFELSWDEISNLAAEPGKPALPSPEDAVNHEKRRHLARMARQFLRARRIDSPAYRFDVLAIETRPGVRPEVRLHKGAFAPNSR